MPDDDRENRPGSRRQGPGRTVAIAGREPGRSDGSSGLSQSQPDDGSARNAALIKALGITGRGTLSPRSGRGTAKQGERETGRRRSPMRPTPGRADITGGPKKAARPDGGVGRITGRRGRRPGAEQNRIRRAGEPRNGGAGDAGWGSVSSRALTDGRGASALVPSAFKPRRTWGKAGACSQARMWVPRGTRPAFRKSRAGDPGHEIAGEQDPTSRQVRLSVAVWGPSGAVGSSDAGPP